MKNNPCRLLAFLLILLCGSTGLFAQYFDMPQVRFSTDGGVLLHLRLPLPWSNPAVPEQSREELAKEILRGVAPRNTLGFSLRNTLPLLDSHVNLWVLPPRAPFPPVPTIAIEGRHRSKPEVMALAIETLFLDSLKAANPGAKLDFLKFRREKGEEDESINSRMFFAMMHYKLTVDKEKFALMATGDAAYQPRDLLEDTVKQADFLSESSYGDGFLLFLNMERVLSVYEPFIENMMPSMMTELKISALYQIKQLKMYTQNDWADLKTRLEIDWAEGSELYKLFSVEPRSMPALSSSKFNGSLSVAKMDSRDFIKAFLRLAPGQGQFASNWMQLVNATGLGLSFSWNRGAPGPVIFLPLKEKDKFEAALRQLLGRSVRVTEEKIGKREYKHISWNNNTVSYAIEGDALIFSPMLHALRDLKQVPPSTKAPSSLYLEYPSSGSAREGYYAAIHLLAQAISQSGYAVNLNAFPAFSALKGDDTQPAPTRKATLSLKTSKDRWELEWDQPYGIVGVLSGVETSMSGFLSFASLLMLTGRSL